MLITDQMVKAEHQYRREQLSKLYAARQRTEDNERENRGTGLRLVLRRVLSA